MLDYLADRPLPAPKELEDPQTNGVSQTLEEARGHRVKGLLVFCRRGVGHINPH